MSLRERKTAKKKKEIIQSAVSIIGEKGYHATTMEEIASKLLMTKGSVYYYFKDKQELLFQSQKLLLEQSLENIKEVIKEKEIVQEKLREAMVVHVEFLLTESTGFEIGAKPEQLFSGKQLEEILSLRNQYSQYIDELIIEGVEAQVFHEADVKIVRNILLGAMNSVIEWYSTDGQKGKQEIAELMADYLLRILKRDC
ncbi:DNA-binding transcriptional regulator, AcrR family [Salinibacillus kushneri]|uniref:DNA-binding transcriptional regulator, AcrR family n=1 Tax=Salinibacillus kushneri TaxID=237682 RepID=A0A1I0FMQ4_9BACI|nr:TetR/AcrR family transcriptional regulator [Salinibacillus kushneri]SET59605.1 DNA-binding transcriptional regulator, AcrR family [Salinibacillus kushneri]